MKYIYLFLLSISTLFVQAQEEGTLFREMTLPEAQTLVGRNADGPQLIFVDCYTQWCAPCKMMVKEIFPQEKVARFMNDNFISLKFDMEKEGKELGKRFGIRSYPTFLILDKNGSEVNRIVGGTRDADSFLMQLRKAMIPKPKEEVASFITVSEDSVLLKGRISDSVSELKLLETRNGRTVTVITPIPVVDGRFSIAFMLQQKGIYILSDGFRDYRLYLTPGTYADLTLSNGELTLNQTNSQPLRLQTMWDFVSMRAKQHSVFLFGDEYESQAFFDELNGLIAYTKHLVPEYMTTDADFNKLMPQLTHFDIAYYALNYAQSVCGRKLATADFPDIYHQLFHNDSMKENTLMQLPYGLDFLALCTRFLNREEGQKVDLEHTLSKFVNPLYKGELVLQHVERMNGYDDVKQLTDQYSEYLTTDIQKTRTEKLLNRLLPYKKGNKAFPFTFIDDKGKSVSLSDFKGKLVLIDVWSTTCAPCKVEFPYLKKLHEQFSGKKIVFVGISTDMPKNKENWQTYIDKENLPGIQLFAGGWDNSVVKDYQISSIPRYMLFDKEGNIITVDAPNPSDPQLLKLIEDNMKK